MEKQVEHLEAQLREAHAQVIQTWPPCPADMLAMSSKRSGTRIVLSGILKHVTRL